MTNNFFHNSKVLRSDNGSGNQMDIPSDGDILSPESSAGFSPAATPTPSSTTESYDLKGYDWQSVRPGRSQIFPKYLSAGSNEAQGWATLAMRMDPAPEAQTRCYREVLWAAALHIKTPDMPRLMREGFFWSPENILPEEGYISRETRPEWVKLGFIHKRTWILADMSNDEVPRWVGLLDVFAPALEILPSFQVQNLAREHVYSASAWNGLNQLVYNYYYGRPKQSFNCIYDNKLLSGWWPWPRAEGMPAASTTPWLDRVGEPSTHFSVSGSQPRPSSDNLHEPRERQTAEEPNEPQHFEEQPTGCVIL